MFSKMAIIGGRKPAQNRFQEERTRKHPLIPHGLLGSQKLLEWNGKLLDLGVSWLTSAWTGITC